MVREERREESWLAKKSPKKLAADAKLCDRHPTSVSRRLRDCDTTLCADR